MSQLPPSPASSEPEGTDEARAPEAGILSQSTPPPLAITPRYVPFWTRFRAYLFATRIRQGLTLGLATAVIVILAHTLGWLDGSERGALNALFRWRGHALPSPDVVLVVADEETLANRKFGQWPFRRAVYARLIDHLNRAGAKTIGFDVLFSVPSGKPEDDRALINTCRRVGNVVLAAVFSPQEHPDVSMTASQSGGLVDRAERFRITNKGDSAVDASSGAAPLPQLLDSVPMIGHITVFPEWNGGLLRIPHLIRYRGDTYPSLALAMAAHYLGLKPQQIMATNENVEIIGRRIPLNEQGETLVNWTGPTNTIPTYTFQQVLDPDPGNEVPDSTFKNAVVLVGIVHPGAYDRYATPFSPNQPAVELQANALDNILQNHPLREAPEIWHLLLLTLACLLAGVLTAQRGARVSALWAIGLGLVLWSIGFSLLWRGGVYLDVAAPVLGVIATCAATLGYRQLRDASDLKIAEERYALAARGANDGIWDWDLQSGQIYFSPRWRTMLGYNEAEITPDPREWFKRVHFDDLDKLQADLTRHIEGHSVHFEHEHRLLHADGAYRWVLARGLRVLDEQGRPARVAGSLTDITDRKVAEEQLLRNAFYDGLTALPNRALFMDRLGRAIGRARRHTDYLFAVLFLDLDRFKVVNDSLGHLIGDQLLIAVAKRLESCLRPGDTAARLGGDEFTLLLDDIHDEQDVTRVAERLQSELAKPFILDGQEVFPSASIGIALSGSPSRATAYERADDLLRDADTAMYRAKALGRGRHEVFDEGMHARAVALLRLETDLRRAIESDDFHVFYQPIVSLENGRIRGFEALARWEHPERGLVPPGEFIALAEETGLVIALDHSILRQACRQTLIWHQQFDADREATPARGNGASRGPVYPPLSLSANLSSKHFLQGNVMEEVREILEATNFPPGCLRLEITESVILENIESAAKILDQLKTLGVQLALDDFGTGYSSLSYLHRLPLDIIKIDRSFVSRMGAQGENMEIVRAILMLATTMKMTVVAEGIETGEQMQLLKEMGCDYGQGFYFSRPVSSDETTTLLMEDRAWQTLDGNGTAKKGAAKKSPDGAATPRVLS